MPRLWTNDFSQIKRYKFLLWVGVFLNALLPALEAPCEIVYSYYLDFQEVQINWLDISYVVTYSLTRFAWIGSGCVLIWSVFRIRTLMKSRGENGEEMNLKTLLIHSGAFFLYSASLFVYVIFYGKE